MIQLKILASIWNIISSLVTQIVQVVLLGELKTDPGHIRRLVKTALDALPHNTANPRAFVNPSDIEWLQKDFGLYIVNMFDTHQAARELNFPQASLAYVLKSYCDIDANKQYQLADWKIR